MSADQLIVPRELLERLQERLDPHRDARDWGLVCDVLKAAAPAQDELVVYRAVNQFGGDCHFGVESLARVWAGKKGSVERVTLTPVPDLSVVAARPTQAAKQPSEPTWITRRPLIRNAIRLLGMRRPVAPDVQQVIDDLEMMLTAMPTPSAPADAHWLEVAELADPIAQTPADQPSDCERCAGAGHDYYGENCQHCVAPVDALVEALEEIVKRYPDPNISHVDFRVHACKHAEHALTAYRAGGAA